MKQRFAADGPEKGSLVKRVVQELIDLSLATEAGSRLGSEDELLLRFGVSRPTLRQAAKVVEAEELLSVRRGLNGGIYAERPDAAHVIRAPARYLRMQDTTLMQMLEIGALLLTGIASSAALCDDAALRGEVETFRRSLDAPEAEKDTVSTMMATDRRIDMLLARMTENPAYLLFMEINYAFGVLERDLKFYRAAEDRRIGRALIQQLCDAVLARDADIARIIARRRSALIKSWIR